MPCDVCTCLVQVVGKEDCFYAMPPSKEGTQKLREVMVPASKAPQVPHPIKFGRKNKCKIIVNKSDFDAGMSGELDDSPLMAFRLIHTNPSNQKLMSRLHKLRGDHVAVHVQKEHKIDGVEQILSLVDPEHARIITTPTTVKSEEFLFPFKQNLS